MPDQDPGERVAKALLELVANAVLGATKPQVFGDPNAMAKLDASVKEYGHALNAWAGFEAAVAPIVAPVAPPAPTPAPPPGIALGAFFGPDDPSKK